MSTLTLDSVRAMARAAQDDSIGQRANVSGPLSRRRRTLVATITEWRADGFVNDQGATCVGCGDFTVWADITLGHDIPDSVCKVQNGRTRVTDMLPECGPCNRAHGAARMPYVPRYTWPERFLSGRVSLPADPGSGYAYAGRNSETKDSDTMVSRKIAQWISRD